MAVIIDGRKKSEMTAQMKRLAKSYVPEWNFDQDNPDIGSTIGLIYAKQAADNAERINQVIDRYHAEFVNLLDITVRPARPAESIVVMNPVQDTINGVFVKKGTRLLASAPQFGGEDTIFETRDNVYITGAKIKNAFMTDRERGTITPLLGELKVPEIYERSGEADEEAEEIDALDETGETASSIGPFKLFGEEKGVEKNALLFYHSCIFDVENDDIYVRINGCDKLIAEIVAGRKYFAYVSEGSLKRVEKVTLLSDGNTFCLVKEGVNEKQQVGNEEYSMLALIDDNQIIDDYKVNSITFSALGSLNRPDFVSNGITDMDVTSFTPFNDELAVYQECYIGSDTFFAKKGSKITVSFKASYREKLLSLTPVQEDEQLKVIKKKPKNIMSTAVADVFVQSISAEYFNGIGWKKLPVISDISRIFAEVKEGEYSFSFMCPDDWDVSQVGGYEGRSIRLQVLKADNCYIRPSLHHYPVINDLRVSFSYEDRYLKPDRLFGIYATKKLDLVKELNMDAPYYSFKVSDYSRDELYLGLDKRPESGPISMLIRMAENERYNELPCIFEYSTRDGFKELKIIDGTQNMSRTGVIMFLPPADFYNTTIEGTRAFWIRVARMELQKDDSNHNLPVIEDIVLNGVIVQNTNTYMEEDLYQNEITVGARFPLSQTGIMDADVWVNEFGNISQSERNYLMDTAPDRVRAEYDVQGNLSAFYVKWNETDLLRNSDDKRVYELDRIGAELIFGDGIHTEIPRVVDDVALKIVVRCSNGKAGNVLEGAIDNAIDNLYFIGDINNPVKAYGGCDMESIEDALERGSNIISSRRRLVSYKDYCREIFAFSDVIHLVECVHDINSDYKKDEGALAFLILMKDFKDGSYSFHKLQEDLKKHILERCSIALLPDNLYILEPCFVEISVIAWIKANRMQDSFELQSRIDELLTDYLDPVSETGGRWKIGSLPTTDQIHMKINIFKQWAIIRNLTVVARYKDSAGIHEVDLSELKVRPFMLGVSGEHQIHVEL